MPESIFVQALNVLKAIGAFRVIFPFMLIFSVVFGTLERTKVFGDDASDVNALVAFSIAILFIGMGSAVGTLSSFVPLVGLLSVFVISLIMIIALFYDDVSKLMEETNWKWVVIAVVMGWLIIGLLYAMGAWEFLFGEGGTNGGAWMSLIGNIWSTYGPALVLIIILLVLVYLITREE